MRWLFMPLFGLITFGASAQCFKDIECKGDRVCDKGVCVAPSQGQTILEKAAPTTPQSNTWSNEVAKVVGSALQDQLACASRPEPGKALRALRARGVILQKPIAAVDGMKIFAVEKPISVFGFRVLQVTGWEDSNDKSLFWRGPGTAPPHHIQAVVDGELSAVKREVERIAGKKVSFSKASYSNYSSPATEITCYAQ